MKFLAFAFIVLFALVLVSGEESGPVNLANNNIGNIVTVSLDANAVVSNNVEQNIVAVLLALLNQQASVVSASGAADS